MAEVIAIEITAKGSQKTAQELAEVELRLKEISDALRKAKSEGDSDIYADLRKEQISLQESGKNLRNELKQQIREFNAADLPADSIVRLPGR